MNAYQRYMKMKALSEFWEGLSDPDKQMLLRSRHENENVINQKLDVITQKIDKNRHSFGFGVLENITGNAAYDAAIWILKTIVKVPRI